MQSSMSNAESLPPIDSFNGDIFQIDVGQTYNRRPFFVHRNLLCNYSGYFAGVLKGQPANSKVKTHQLIVEDPSIFEMFVYWLYTRRIPSPGIGPHYDPLTLCQLWVFGEARQIPLLQDDTIDLFVRTAAETKSVPTSHVNWIYARTLPDSPLRRVFIDLASKTVGRGVLEKAKTWPKEALVDLAAANWEDRKTIPSAEVLDTFQITDYHVSVKND